MAIQLLDRKILRRTGFTGTATHEFKPWNFSSVGLSGKTRIIVDWDIVAIPADVDTTNTYPNWYLKKWIIDYIPGFGAKILDVVTINVSSPQISWFDSASGSEIIVTAQVTATARVFTLCGSAQIASCAET